MIKKTRKQHELDRTEILRFLNEAGFQPVTPAMLLTHLDEIFHTESAEGLDYNLRYMCARGWVELQESRILGQAPRILCAKITPAGVDELDRRTPGESGVRV